MYHFLHPDLYGYYRCAIYLISFNRSLLQKKKTDLANLEDSGYNSASLESNLLEMEGSSLVN